MSLGSRLSAPLFGRLVKNASGARAASFRAPAPSTAADHRKNRRRVNGFRVRLPAPGEGLSFVPGALLPAPPELPGRPRGLVVAAQADAAAQPRPRRGAGRGR